MIQGQAMCPTVRSVGGWYYCLYLAQCGPWNFETRARRSRDLNHWSSAVTVMQPDRNEGVNVSDVDFVEWRGQTVLYYLAGDQRSWMALRRANFNGTERDFLEFNFR